MAEATEKITVENITLTLSKEEAQAVFDVLSMISPYESRRRYIQSVYNALYELESIDKAFRTRRDMHRSITFLPFLTEQEKPK